ncbi:hypothetical protein FDE94_09480 [Clostridium botulinum]|nr:hypothetical protein [Clostridium botulinum]NHI48096.1 hypothetical protein [Clostridium botulinum]
MKIDKTQYQVYGFESAFRGMRNPMNSWSKSDSYNYLDKIEGIEDIHAIENSNSEGFILGKNDLNLAQRLIKAGSEHCKFLRQIQVWVDMDLPRYIWSEFDTYKFNSKNSSSTMHKLLNKQKEISVDDFEFDDNNNMELWAINNAVNYLNKVRQSWLNAKTEEEKRECITSAKRILPESFLQLRTVNTNYAELRSIYKQRHNHRLKEWHKICDWIETLPYAKELIIYGINNSDENK